MPRREKTEDLAERLHDVLSDHDLTEVFCVCAAAAIIAFEHCDDEDDQISMLKSLTILIDSAVKRMEEASSHEKPH